MNRIVAVTKLIRSMHLKNLIILMAIGVAAVVAQAHSITASPSNALFKSAGMRGR